MSFIIVFGIRNTHSDNCSHILFPFQCQLCFSCGVTRKTRKRGKIKEQRANTESKKPTLWTLSGERGEKNLGRGTKVQREIEGGLEGRRDEGWDEWIPAMFG